VAGSTNHFEEEMTNGSFRHLLLSLLFALFLNMGFAQALWGSSEEAASNSSDAQSQSESELQPPDWQTGDSWVVETEIFDQGNVMKRADDMGWTEAQAWRFEVLGIESIDNRRNYQLQISSINGNACPYLFMIWLRTSDLQLSAFQIVYPAEDNGSSRPRSIRKEISETQTPDAFFDYFKARFPSLPLWLLPQFNNDTAPAAPNAYMPGPQTKLNQKIAIHSAPIPSEHAPENAAAVLPYRSAKTSDSRYHKVTLSYGDAQEIQYWEDGRPWPVYGYKSGKNGVEKVYRLTQVGRDNTAE
jgi:hypothetical protein